VRAIVAPIRLPAPVTSAHRPSRETCRSCTAIPTSPSCR